MVKTKHRICKTTKHPGFLNFYDREKKYIQLYVVKASLYRYLILDGTLNPANSTITHWCEDTAFSSNSTGVRATSPAEGIPVTIK